MSTEEFYRGEEVDRETLKEIVERALSGHKMESSTEERVRERVMYVEALDTLERVDLDELEDSRELLQEELDEVFTDLARKRKAQAEGDDVLRGSMTASHLIDAFGETELSRELQRKYHELSEYIEKEVTAAGFVETVIASYSPQLSEVGNAGMEEGVVGYLIEEVERNDIPVPEINGDTIEEAIRKTYPEEKYREDEENTAMAPEAIKRIGPDPFAAEVSEIGEEELAELERFYQEHLSRFALTLGEEMNDTMPYETADEIYS